MEGDELLQGPDAASMREVTTAVTRAEAMEVSQSTMPLDGPTTTMNIFDRDEINLVAVFLDGPSLGNLACSCKAVADNLRSRHTIQWLADLRGLQGDLAGISSVEHLEIAEVMASVTSNIYFGWGGMDVDARVHPSLVRLAQLLHRHRNISISIEAHCGLEARFAMPLPSQARDFTRSRAEAVRRALVHQAVNAGCPLDETRVKTRAWGCSRPLVWCFGQHGMGEPYSPEGAAKNRRVELYLRSGAFEVPARRKRSEIPRPPGEASYEDVIVDVSSGELALDDNDDDGTADVGASLDQIVEVVLPNGQVASVTTAMLMQHLMHVQMGDGDDDDDDEDEDEDEEEQQEGGHGSMDHPWNLEDEEEEEEEEDGGEETDAVGVTDGDGEVKS